MYQHLFSLVSCFKHVPELVNFYYTADRSLFLQLFFSDGFLISSRLNQTSFIFIAGNGNVENVDQKMNLKF